MLAAALTAKISGDWENVGLTNSQWSFWTMDNTLLENRKVTHKRQQGNPTIGNQMWTHPNRQGVELGNQVWTHPNTKGEELGNQVWTHPDRHTSELGNQVWTHPNRQEQELGNQVWTHPNTKGQELGNQESELTPADTEQK